VFGYAVIYLALPGYYFNRKNVFITTALFVGNNYPYISFAIFRCDVRDLEHSPVKSGISSREWDN
jgi:hypothetical protein